jgi:hypothetical protein
MKIRKLVAAAAVAGSVALLAPQAASAGEQGSSFTLPPGNRVCLDDPSLAFYSARATGSASPGVKFTFLVRPYGAYGYTLLTETGNSVTSWGAETNRYIHPWAFPGNFRACARNNGTSSAQVFLHLSSS